MAGRAAAQVAVGGGELPLLLAVAAEAEAVHGALVARGEPGLAVPGRSHPGSAGRGRLVAARAGLRPGPVPGGRTVRVADRAGAAPAVGGHVPRVVEGVGRPVHVPVAAGAGGGPVEGDVAVVARGARRLAPQPELVGDVGEEDEAPLAPAVDQDGVLEDAATLDRVPPSPRRAPERRPRRCAPARPPAGWPPPPRCAGGGRGGPRCGAAPRPVRPRARCRPRSRRSRRGPRAARRRARGSRCTGSSPGRRRRA